MGCAVASTVPASRGLEGRSHVIVPEQRSGSAHEGGVPRGEAQHGRPREPHAGSGASGSASTASAQAERIAIAVTSEARTVRGFIENAMRIPTHETRGCATVSNRGLETRALQGVIAKASSMDPERSRRRSEMRIGGAIRHGCSAEGRYDLVTIVAGGGG
jgi:hypothetical protein